MCIFVEELCLVAARQVSRHLKGRSVVCRARLSTTSLPLLAPPRPPFLRFSSPCSMLGIHGLQTKQANKQNNRKTHQPDKAGLGLGERDGERSCLFSGPVSFHCDGRGGLPGHGYPHLCLTSSRDQGGPQSALKHPLLTQYTAGGVQGPVAFT